MTILFKDLNAVSAAELLFPYYRFCMELAEPDPDFCRSDEQDWLLRLVNIRPDRIVAELFYRIGSLHGLGSNTMYLMTKSREENGVTLYTVGLESSIDIAMSLCERQGWGICR